MGIILCTTSKDKNEILSLIEKSINNKKTTLDKKIYEEYYSLKSFYKPQKKPDSNKNSREKEKDKEKENFPIAYKKIKFIPVKKRMNRFIKWYFMSHPNQNPNMKNKHNSYSEAKIRLNNNNNNNNNKEINLEDISNTFNKNLNFNKVSNSENDNYDANFKSDFGIKKNQRERNLRNNFAISPITYNNENSNNRNNNLNANESKNLIKNSDQSYFNNTVRLKKINPNEISPILNHKKVQLFLESDKAGENFLQSSNMNVNLNSRFNNIPYVSQNENYNNYIIGQNKTGENIDSALISQRNYRNNSNSKLSSTATIPNLNNFNNINRISLNSNSVMNYNIYNICNSNSITKLKALKANTSVKIISKSEENPSSEPNRNSCKNKKNNNNNNEESQSNLPSTHNNRLNLDYTYSNSNDNYNHNSKSALELQKANTNTNTNTYTNITFCDNLSSKSNNENKSTTARCNNNNTKSNNNTYTQKEDTISNSHYSNSNSHSQTNEKNHIFNNFYNTSQDNNNDQNSICQQLNIFDDSNIIESNLRLFFKLEREKFLKRVVKGPPESFRWVAWLISCNLPFERSKDFYAFLLAQQLSPETDIEIKKDLNRTLSGFKISNSIMDDTQLMLYNILKAFSLVDKEVAYCQGMNFVVGFLLLMSDFNELETFYFMLSLFSNTFKDNLAIRGFFLEGFPLLNFYVDVFMKLFSKNLPELQKHFDKLEIPNEVWISKWFRTLFTLSLPLNICMRIWDCLIRFGLDFLLNFALAFMKYIESDLVRKQDLFDVIEYFKKMTPFFALENEEDLGLIAESERFIENFNIEEIILNAKKIKIAPVFIQEQMQLYQKNNKIDLGRIKIKYDLSFKSNDEVGKIEKGYSNRSGSVNKSNNNNNNDYFNESAQEVLNKDTKDNYIHTETCRSEFEKSYSNLNTKRSRYNNLNKIHSILNFGNINAENNVQNLITSESNKVDSTIKNTNINNNNNLKIYEDNNLSVELENSQHNSDSDSNSNAIKNKINNYTFKAKTNLNDKLIKLYVSEKNKEEK